MNVIRRLNFVFSDKARSVPLHMVLFQIFSNALLSLCCACGFCILFDPPKTYIFNLRFRLCERESVCRCVGTRVLHGWCSSHGSPAEGSLPSEALLISSFFLTPAHIRASFITTHLH